MKKFIIIIDGPMGSGKSTIGALLHKKLKRTALLSFDKIKWFVSDFDRSAEDNRMTAMILRAMTAEYMKQGINLLLPQAFWKKEHVLPYVQLAKENEYELFMYQLEAEDDVLLKRVDARAKLTVVGTPLTKAKILDNLNMWKDNKYDLGRHFDTTNTSAESVAKIIFDDVRK